MNPEKEISDKLKKYKNYFIKVSHHIIREAVAVFTAFPLTLLAVLCKFIVWGDLFIFPVSSLTKKKLVSDPKRKSK